MKCKATGKIQHLSKEAAIIAQKRIGNPNHVNAFKCPKCKKWHLGRSNSPTRWSDRISQVLEKYNKKMARSSAGQNG